AALIGVLAAVLIGCAIGGVWFGQYKEQQARKQEKLKDAESAARQQAEEAFNSARDAVEKLLVRIGAEKLEQVPRAEKLRRELLEQALTFYDRFLTVHGDNPAVRREAAWAYQRVGRIRNDLGDRKA